MMRRLGLFAPVLVTLALVACGGDDEDAAEETTTTTAAEEETTTTTAVEEETTTTEAGGRSTTTSTTAVEEDPWQAHAVALRSQPIGSEHEFDCPGGGTPDSVWGTDIYTDDSSVCTAAVHAGVITIEDGGTVTIALEGPQESYLGTERNGITSLSYPAWEGSYSIVSAD